MDLAVDRAKLKELYMPGVEDFMFVDVPEMPFAVIDGTGAPDDAIKRLFVAIQPIRRQARAELGKTFVEAPLEMLHWADDPMDLVAGDRTTWRWRAMIVLPTGIDNSGLADARADAPRMERLHEGRCVQIMHVGATSTVPRLLERLYTEFLPKHGLEPSGPYHEIYLDDWSRTAPENRKMVLRQPVRSLSPRPQD